MAVQLASNIAPKNGQTYYMMEDIYLKGGLQVRNDITDRDSIPISNLKLGALCLTVDDGKIWKVTTLVQITPETPDVTESATWEELKLGGGDDGTGTPGDVQRRAVVIHTIETLAVDSEVEFPLSLGTSVIVLRLTVSRPVRVKAFSTAAKDDPNPYEFLATEDHLTDDGSQKLADGTIFRTRNYSILANFEDPAKNDIYFTVSNVGEDEGPVTLTLTYVPLETAAEDEEENTVTP
jgi:hypothetical protein